METTDPGFRELDRVRIYSRRKGNLRELFGEVELLEDTDGEWSWKSRTDWRVRIFVDGIGLRVMRSVDSGVFRFTSQTMQKDFPGHWRVVSAENAAVAIRVASKVKREPEGDPIHDEEPPEDFDGGEEN